MTNNKSTKGKERQLPANYHLGRFDVLCCRGKVALEHEGNCRFRAMVQHHLPQYSQSSCKVAKSHIVSTIVESVRQASPEGGFVKFVDDGWIVVNDRFAREKVGQTFRDLLHNKYKSSMKAKARARGSELVSIPLTSVPVHDQPSYVSNGDSPAKLLVQADQDTLLTSNLAWLQQVQPSSAPAPFEMERLPSPAPAPATNALARVTGSTQEHATSGLVPNIDQHPNFLEQIIQGLDRPSNDTHVLFEDLINKPFGMSSSLATEAAAEESKTQPQQCPHEMSVESSHILSDLDLEPLSISDFPTDDLQNSSTVFSIDHFHWDHYL